MITRKTYNIEELDCAVCAKKVEDAINCIDGVKAAVSFITGKLTVEAEESEQEELKKKIQKIAKRIEPDCRIC